MRIFKNRGDIYFSKTNKEKSLETRILVISLAVIVVFTIVFTIALGVKYDFSAKKFFAPENQQTTIQQNEEKQLPQVEGKTNFLFMTYHDNELLFVSMIQVDLDNTSYKVSCLKADTKIDSKSLATIFKQSGAKNVEKAIESSFSIDFDYYIAMEYRKYTSFADSLGKINYPVLNSVKFKKTDGAMPYTVKINSGEQSLKTSEAVGLIRYYLDEENNTTAANDIILNALSQLINSENMENGDNLFSEFVTSCETNITIKDYSLADEKLLVLSNEKTGARVYNAALEYDKDKVKDDSLKEVKGYFVK